MLIAALFARCRATMPCHCATPLCHTRYYVIFRYAFAAYFTPLRVDAGVYADDTPFAALQPLITLTLMPAFFFFAADVAGATLLRHMLMPCCYAMLDATMPP